jgi:hypothetical protein
MAVQPLTTKTAARGPVADHLTAGWARHPWKIGDGMYLTGGKQLGRHQIGTLGLASRCAFRTLLELGFPPRRLCSWQILRDLQTPRLKLLVAFTQYQYRAGNEGDCKHGEGCQ